MKKIIESYKIKSEGLTVDVNIIIQAGLTKKYEIIIPEIKEATRALLDEIKHELITEVKISTAEILDIKIIESLKKKFNLKAKELIKNKIPDINENTLKLLIGILLNEMLGLENIEFLLNDENLEEIVIVSSKEPIRVYHKKYGWLETNISVKNEDQIQNYGNIIARRVGRQVTTLNPLLDAHLITGDRANVVLYPVATKGNTLTIRKFARDPWTVVDFIQNNTCNSNIFALLWLAVQYEMNVLISGGTASGKTSFLNILMPFIPPNHRVLSIEDSVLKDSQILYCKNGKFNMGGIGDLIDTEIGKRGCILKDGCEIAHNPNIKIFSMTREGRIELSSPSSLIRHKVNKEVYEVKLASGKKISVTKDHSLFTLYNNQITTIKPSELEVGNFIATPRNLVYDGTEIEFDITNYLKKFKRFIIKGSSLKPIIKKNLSKLGKYANKYLKKQYLPINKIIELDIKLNGIDKKQLSISTKRASKYGRRDIPVLIKIDKNLACLSGLWLADGCYDKRSTILSSIDKEERQIIRHTARPLSLPIKMHSDKFSLMINSVLFKTFLHEVLELKGDAYNKKIPNWIYNLRLNELSWFLKGYFSGDGCAKKFEVSCSSVSLNLLEGIQTLLLRYGIILRIHKNIRADRTYDSSISDTKFLKIFKEKIGFLQAYKNKKLELSSLRNRHEVSDIIPLKYDSYIKIKHAAGQNFKELYNYKYWKSWQGRYRIGSNIGRNNLQYIMGFIETKDPKIDVISTLAFNDLLWDQVTEIKKINFSGYVYDLSVPGNESFVCNNIIVHNTRELQLPEFLYWTPLITRQPNPEGLGEVSMLDLLVNSLRMRPDRIILGEIRRAREAEVLFEAMHTGHSVYSTVHADSMNETIQRLINPPINVSPNLLSAVNLNVVMFRDRKKGIRRVYQIGEFLNAEEEGKTIQKPNILYRWNPGKDAIVEHASSLRFFDELSRHTGMSMQEISKEIKNKKAILDYLVKNKLRTIEYVGKFMKEYYINQDFIQDIIRKNKKPKEIFGL